MFSDVHDVHANISLPFGLFNYVLSKTKPNRIADKPNILLGLGLGRLTGVNVSHNTFFVFCQ